MIFGSTIKFPSLLLKELISTYSWNHKIDTERFNFVFRGHFQDLTLKELKSFNIPPDNTPAALVGVNDSDLTKQAKTLHLTYINDYQAIKYHCDQVINTAIKNSNLDISVVDLVCRTIKYTPSKLNAKVFQHLFMIGLHARLLGKSKNKYINCIHNNYYHILSKNKSFKKQQLDISTPNQDLVYLPEILFKQYQDFRRQLNHVLHQASRSDRSWIRITATAPGEWHSISSNWNGRTPAETRKEYFQKKWRKIQDSLNKQGLLITGFWTVEFHADGCPHLNFFITLDKATAPELLKLFVKHFQHSPKSIHVRHQPINGDHESLNRNITYITKSLFPRISSQNIHRRLFDRSIASIFRIRLYGFFGM